MHIAHRLAERHLTVQEVAKSVGLKRRQIAYEAKNGKIPDVIRPDSYHNQYPLTPRNLSWMKQKRREVKRRKQRNLPRDGRSKKGAGVITIQAIHQQFDVWLRRVGGIEGLLKMERHLQEEIIGELDAIHWLVTKLRAQRHR